MLLFVVLVLIYPALAQQVNQCKKVMTNKLIAQERPTAKTLAGLNGSCIQFPVSYNIASKQFLNGDNPSIKLDSVVTTNNYDSSNPALQWISPIKKVYYYDGNFCLYQIIEMTWHRRKKEYGITGKTLLFYNTDGLVDSIHYQMNVLNEYYSDKYIYDKTGRLLTSYRYRFSFGAWILAEKREYSYNALGKLSQIKLDESTGNNNFNISILKCTYDQVGKLIESKYFAPGGMALQTLYEWDLIGNLKTEYQENFVYGGKSKIDYWYNENDDIVKANFYDQTKSGWFQYTSIEYKYCGFDCTELVNVQLPSTTLPKICKQAADFSSVKLISEIKTDYGYNIYEKNSYFYTPLNIASSVDIYFSKIRVYPNPATDRITFTWNQNYKTLQLKLFQLTGACLFDREVSSNETINLEKLPKGIYLYKLSDKKQILNSGKLVIQ